jgi:hypothetical protein
VARKVAGLRGGPGLSAAELKRIEAVINDRVAAAELEGGIRIERVGPFLSMRRSA